MSPRLSVGHTAARFPSPGPFISMNERRAIEGGGGRIFHASERSTPNPTRPDHPLVALLALTRLPHGRVTVRLFATKCLHLFRIVGDSASTTAPCNVHSGAQSAPFLTVHRFQRSVNAGLPLCLGISLRRLIANSAASTTPAVLTKGCLCAAGIERLLSSASPASLISSGAPSTTTSIFHPSPRRSKAAPCLHIRLVRPRRCRLRSGFPLELPSAEMGVQAERRAQPTKRRVGRIDVEDGSRGAPSKEPSTDPS